MPKVQVMSDGTLFQYEATEGSNFLLEAISESIPIPFKCTKGNCAKCYVKITSGSDHLSEPTEREYHHIGDEGLTEGNRLACQCFVYGDVEAVIEPR
ncbi:Ferredoxin [Thermoactinomyces sp. DSM 45891]|uniref:2Fe-2S iron-sulfur cluster-binding protein n=1 Tax=Thermoactinomyces sp. DSM 45891 TaxID=1761907 RepID=UPI00091F9EFB|nr:2Fe-2S iron-sulfur cluster-binding protein [Thermoactinomyces sp. DSM 45891]SFX28842.1 Ferredoxin [Thermoactinomyces sp. DSM 45891]